MTTMLSRWQSGHRSLRVTKLLGTKRTVGHHSEHLGDHCPHYERDLGTGRSARPNVRLSAAVVCGGKRKEQAWD